MDGPKSGHTDGTDRRRFLHILGALGVTGIAGCGGGDGETEEPTETTQPMGTTSPGTGETPTDTATETATPTDTPTPREPQFVSLFDGGSLEDAHWHQVNGTATYESRDENTIVGISDSSSPNSFLSTYKVFDDFELEFEAWVDPEGLNSGIQIRSNTSQDHQHVHGPQVELELSGDSAPQIAPGQSGYVYGESLSTGWMSGGGSAPPAHEVFNNGEWNDFRIRAEGDQLQTFINGEQIGDLDLSGFADVEDLLPMGIVALQVHSIGADGREVRWRNIRIKELDVQEWTPLFNGQNTDGWTNPLGGGDATVSDGELHLSGDDSFFLLTEDSYDDFAFETWVNADAKGGVMVRNPGGNRISGYRAEIDPTDDALSGSLYSVGDQAWLANIEGQDHVQMAFKPDGWNYYRVAAAGDTIRVWVNGITTANVTDDAESEGGIGLQHRGGDGTIRFRDLEVKPIEPDDL
jgi:hypothetical protein